MKHSITFEEEDLLQFVRDMLAMRGVAPVGDIKIEELRDGEQKEGTVPKHYINVVCKDTAPLLCCPLCKHSLALEPVAPTKPVTEVLTRQAQEEPESDEPEEPTESVILDESLGESLDPPEPPTRTGKRPTGGGPSIASLRAQSERVRREREPSLPKRPRGIRE